MKKGVIFLFLVLFLVLLINGCFNQKEEICNWQPGACEALVSEGYYYSSSTEKCEFFPQGSDVVLLHSKHSRNVRQFVNLLREKPGFIITQFNVETILGKETGLKTMGIMLPYILLETTDWKFLQKKN